MGNCQACLRGGTSKQGRLQSKDGPYALLSADNNLRGREGKGKRAAVARPHFNATFDEKAEGEGAQPEELSHQQEQMLTASSRLESLPRVSEETTETPLSGKDPTAYEDARDSIELPAAPQEVAHVHIDFGSYINAQAVPEIESTPAKVFVEFEEYQGSSALEAPRGSPIVKLVKGLLSSTWNTLARGLMRNHICYQLPLIGRRQAQSPIAAGALLQRSSNPKFASSVPVLGPPDLARPKIQYSLAENPQPVHRKNAANSPQAVSYEGGAVNKSQPEENAAELPQAVENADSGDDQQAPSTDGVTEEDLAEGRALEEQLRTEVQSARRDVFTTLSTLADLQARFKHQFMQFQENIDNKTK